MEKFGDEKKARGEKVCQKALKFVCLSVSGRREREKRQFRNMEEAELFLHFSFISIQPSFKFHLKTPYRLSIHPFTLSLHSSGRCPSPFSHNALLRLGYGEKRENYPALSPDSERKGKGTAPLMFDSHIRIRIEEYECECINSRLCCSFILLFYPVKYVVYIQTMSKCPSFKIQISLWDLK